MQVLDSRGTLTLDRLKLRKLAFEFVGGASATARTTDVQVLERQLAGEVSNDREIQNVAILSGLVASHYRFSFEPATDLEITSREHLQVSESYWRKLVSRHHGRPWVFVCNYAENEASAVHGDVHGITYGFHEDVTTWRGIVTSGPGSLIVFYNTSHAPVNKLSFTGVARVRRVHEMFDSSNNRRKWRVHLEDYQDIQPVRANAITIPGRNVQHGIQAITWNSFAEILDLGQQPIDRFEELEVLDNPTESGTVNSSPLDRVAGRGPDLVIPVPNPLRLSVSEEVAYELSDEVRGQSVEGKRDGRDSATNKRKEIRAIEIATTYMQLQGWTLARDCQKDGVGFDLEFARGDETLLVEVKGIGGPAIAFNMTAKEWHLCTTNSKFLLIAVTNVLDDDAFRVNPLWPVDICRLQRRATQYRFESDHIRPIN
jgi:hypothetical protein